MESFPSEAILTNVLGTQIMADMAIHRGTEIHYGLQR
jgi:FlaA1/EpsC-like NDP-sugar epimerase